MAILPTSLTSRLGLDRLVSRLSPPAAFREAQRLSERGASAEAFKLFALAAEGGMPEAEHKLAACYFEGLGVPASHAEGVRWLLRAAEHGDVESQVWLAGMCSQGVIDLKRQSRGLFDAEPSEGEAPTEPDFESAAKWAARAAEAGSAKAAAILGYVLTRAPPPLRDLTAAQACYRRSAAAGCPEGSLGYAMSLGRDNDDPAAQAEVARHLRDAAAADLPTAIYLLGVVTERGAGVERDPAAALDLFRRAADLGLPAAQARYGAALMDGDLGPRDLTEAESWLRRAAQAGDLDAAARVGDLNTRGDERPPNYAEAANWYRRAAESGHAASARALASLHLDGRGVARDSDMAAHWLLMAAKAGDNSAQVDFAHLMMQGAGGAGGAHAAAARKFCARTARHARTLRIPRARRR